MEIAALSWNVFHGRDFPPDPALRTRRSQLLRITERGATHAGVNHDLTGAFLRVLAEAEWDVALLQECPPRWERRLASACGAETHRALTSRNSLAALRRLGAWLNPDLVGSDEGGSNLTLARPGAGEITERRELVLCHGPRPERRVMAFTRLASGVCVANLHASSGPPNRARAEDELRAAAAASAGWAGDDALILGGDLNVRPRDSAIYEELADRFCLTGTTAPDSLDHLLARGLRVVSPPERWAPERREVPGPGDLRIRLSDHSPVAAVFAR